MINSYFFFGCLCLTVCFDFFCVLFSSSSFSSRACSFARCLCPMANTLQIVFRTLMKHFFLRRFCLFTYLALKRNYESELMRRRVKKHTKIIHQNRYLFVNSSNYWCGVCYFFFEHSFFSSWLFHVLQQLRPRERRKKNWALIFPRAKWMWCFLLLLFSRNRTSSWFCLHFFFSSTSLWSLLCLAYENRTVVHVANAYRSARIFDNFQVKNDEMSW